MRARRCAARTYAEPRRADYLQAEPKLSAGSEQGERACAGVRAAWRRRHVAATSVRGTASHRAGTRDTVAHGFEERCSLPVLASGLRVRGRDEEAGSGCGPPHL